MLLGVTVIRERAGGPDGGGGGGVVPTQLQPWQKAGVQEGPKGCHAGELFTVAA